MALKDLPPLSSLRAFAALAETRSMTEAGASLNVSHAAISQQVRALEAHLGLKLVIRDGRGIALTAQGARLAETVRDAFHGIGAEIDAMTGADADRPLQITTTPMFAASWLMPRLSDFRERHPEIDLMLNPSAQLVPLDPGGIDLAVRYGSGPWPGLRSELLLRSHFVIVASRKLVGDRQIDDPGELVGMPWLQEYGTNEVTDWLRRHGVTVRLMRGLTQLPGNLLLDALRAGNGVAATTRAFVETDIASGDVVVLFEDEDPTSGYHIVTRPGVLRPSAKAFAAWLRRQREA
ncbi:LysR family transcriptional regulator [Anianabacter salinae]|uniref:LysR family transcriptional regulator n=1 Tax=Anianabacter salinae TaxID=2851023 RepID=UPI00225DEF60|nr:LysR family transcriptional regulator [Anianabacter salinae]MBV0910861.1 LysR family transcriptional regulator [Anianabacter salinae]